MTARAGLSYVDNSNPLNAEVKLPHRGKVTATTIPALDSDLESKVKTRIQGLLKETGCLLISDGWTSIQSRPIIDALLQTPVGARFLKADMVRTR